MGDMAQVAMDEGDKVLWMLIDDRCGNCKDKYKFLYCSRYRDLIDRAIETCIAVDEALTPDKEEIL